MTSSPVNYRWPWGLFEYRKETAPNMKKIDHPHLKNERKRFFHCVGRKSITFVKEETREHIFKASICTELRCPDHQQYQEVRSRYPNLKRFALATS